MFVDLQSGQVSAERGRSGFTVGKGMFTVLLASSEGAIVVLTSVAAGIAYHLAAYGEVGSPLDFLTVGLVTAIWFTLPFLLRAEYEIDNFISGSRGFGRLFNVWTSAFLGLIVIGFLTKTSDVVSRGWLVLFYLSGLAAVTGFDQILRRYVQAAARSGAIEPRRLLLVAPEAEIEGFFNDNGDIDDGLAIVSIVASPDARELDGMNPGDFQAFLNSTVNQARTAEVTDILLLFDPDQVSLLRRVALGLADLPAAIHLGEFGLIKSFPGLRAVRLGLQRTLQLVRPPMTAFEMAMKRSLDLSAAATALLVFIPVFALIALAIKLDSPGPALFRQRRRGFNQREFRIWKFRTMTTVDDGANIVQASRDDARITRVGHILRRFNLDELPQLLNVLGGEMSLVGPRPHAVAHDEHYAKIIERYARRLNFKPGITGWAQVNGYRGPTETEEAMRRRIIHDLAYIDNWSIAFDLQILFLTVFGRKAYRNAF